MKLREEEYDFFKDLNPPIAILLLKSFWMQLQNLRYKGSQGVKLKKNQSNILEWGVG